MCLSQIVNTVKAAAPSAAVNCFRFQIGSRTILGVPAHVAIYPKDNKWKFSSFLTDFDLEKFDWKVPAKYFTDLSPQNDFAYVDVSSLDGPALPLCTTPLELPVPVNVLYRTPFDHGAVWHDKGTWATEEAVLYPAIHAELMEVGGFGFRGLSGAAALDRSSGECLGLFVRRAKALSFKGSKSAATRAPTGLQKAVQDFLGISDLRKCALMVEDLHEALQLAAIRRGVFISGHQIEKLLHEPVVYVKEIVGTTAPDESPM